jgi:hypothetical protein
MVALAISAIKSGRTGPGHPGYERGMAHLKRRSHCRANTPIPIQSAA